MRVHLPLRHSAGAAATLSFLLPGLGQAWAGSIRRGILFASPLVALVATGVVLFLVANPDPSELVGDSVQPEVLVAILVVDGLLLLYRTAAIVDAYRLARRRSPPPARGWMRLAAAGLAVALLAVSFGVHGAVAWVDLALYDDIVGGFTTVVASGEELPGVDDLPALDDETLPPGDEETAEPTASPSPTPTVTPAIRPTSTDQGFDVRTIPPPTPTPAPTPKPKPLPRWAKDGRLNVLLIGGDAGPDRWSLRADTLILLSVDVASGRAALFGIPRNLRNVPLPRESAGAFSCGCFPGMINALYVYAMSHPGQFPGGDSRGYRAIAGAVQELTRTKLDGIAVVTLAGFVRLVDALGGLTIDVPRALYDRNYPLEDGSGWMELSVSAGRHHFDGRMALAYARSRHQDSDYGRMARQQQVLVAFRRQLKPCRLVPRIPALLKAAKGAFWTNIPVKELPGLLALAQHVRANSVIKRSFTPPRYHEALDARQIARIRAEVRDIFGQPDDEAPDPADVDLSC